MSHEVDGHSAFGARRSDERILAEVDRELRAALSVSPSADFEARVLRRVEEDDLPVRSYYPWLAAAAALALAAGLFYALGRAPEIETVSPPQMADRRPDVLLPPIAAHPASAPGEPEASRVMAAARPPRPAARRPEPEVIVPLNQMEAVRRLVRAVNEGRIDAPAEPQEGPMPVPAELAVAPLVVDPIPVPALEPEARTEKRSRDI